MALILCINVTILAVDSARKHMKHKMQRSPNKTNIFKGQAASRMHYAKFYDIFSEDLNSTYAQYFIENAASNMIVVEEDIRTPLLPLTS